MMSIPEDPEERAYNALNGVLQGQNTTAECWAIEILPAALCPLGQLTVVQDGHHIGIPKKLLVFAFKHALKVMQKTLDSDTNTKTAVSATWIILLVAPEHLTACNLRKRHLLSIPGVKQREALQDELYFLDSLLSSPLHRHTKSPTLWAHRHWLLTQFSELLQPHTVLDRELDIILRAAELHPKNYYAWGHLRFLLIDKEQRSRAQGRNIAAVHEFCLSHPSDTSGWSALLFLLDIFVRHDLERAEAEELLKVTVERIAKLRWRGEAVWNFLRTAVAKGTGLSIPMRHDILESLKRLFEETAQKKVLREKAWVVGHEDGLVEVEEGQLLEVIEKSFSWIQKYSI